MASALLAVALFLGTISTLIFLSERKRAYVALAAGLLAVALGVVEPSHILQYLNLDVLGLIAGACVISAYLSESGITSEVARRAVDWSKGDLRKLAWALGMLSGIISLFIENVTTLIMLAPIVFEISMMYNVDAVPILLLVAFASNLGGAALLVGDPQSALAAGYFNLDFVDFIVHEGRPSIFWMVLAALITSTTIFAIKYVRGKVKVEEEIQGIKDSNLAKVTLIALAVKIFLLSVRKELGIGLSLPAFVGAGIILTYQIIRKRSFDDVKFALNSIEWELLMFLAGIFLVVGGLEDTGVMKIVAAWFEGLASCNFWILSATLILLSVAVSGVMDNVPYLLAMFPVISDLSKACCIDYFRLLLALLIGATLGGNITYFGTSTNIAAVHLLAERGYNVEFKRFVKYGLFYTVLALAPAVALYYAIWSP